MKLIVSRPVARAAKIVGLVALSAGTAWLAVLGLTLACECRDIDTRARAMAERNQKAEAERLARDTLAYWTLLVKATGNANKAYRTLMPKVEQARNDNADSARRAAVLLRRAAELISSYSEEIARTATALSGLPTAGIDPEAARFGARYGELTRQLVAALGELADELRDMSKFVQRHSSASDVFLRFFYGDEQMNEERVLLVRREEDTQRKLREYEQARWDLWSEAERVRVRLVETSGLDYPQPER